LRPLPAARFFFFLPRNGFGWRESSKPLLKHRHKAFKFLQAQARDR
jgi:hypothetical protein